MILRNRIVMDPLGTNLADVNGEVTRALIDWYVERAPGRGRLIIRRKLPGRFASGAGCPANCGSDDPKVTPG